MCQLLPLSQDATRSHTFPDAWAAGAAPPAAPASPPAATPTATPLPIGTLTSRCLRCLALYIRVLTTHITKRLRRATVSDGFASLQNGASYQVRPAECLGN